MRVARDPDAEDLKGEPPADLDEEAGALWKLDRYLADYLRCVVAIDENVGRLLDHLDETGQSEDTVVVYTSDQGFFLGEHGWYDKRFMYRESLQMPLLVRYPRLVTPGARACRAARSCPGSTSTAATTSPPTAVSVRATASWSTTTAPGAGSPARRSRTPAYADDVDRLTAALDELADEVGDSVPTG